MIKGLLLAAILVCSLFSASLEAYQKGVVLGLYSKEKNYSYETSLQEIKNVGATHVSLVVSWYQRNIRSNSIYPYWDPIGDFSTIPSKELERVIIQAHKLGLKVFLFPILRIEDRKEKEWRGVLTPEDKKTWFTNYRNFILHYARLAARHKVDLFSVGSELCSLEHEQKFWETLIGDIRTFYRGELTYSANWDHYKKIGFWSKLDYLGLNGYYELTQGLNPTTKELLQRWWGIENELASWQEQLRKKIIFTEIGYPSVDGACGKPWDYTRDVPVDLGEQALCYEAFFLSWAKSSKLGGVYFWDWYGQGGVNDRNYTPRGKPAERVLSSWYHDRPEPLPSLSAPSPYSHSPGATLPPPQVHKLPTDPFPSFQK